MAMVMRPWIADALETRLRAAIAWKARRELPDGANKSGHVHVKLEDGYDAPCPFIEDGSNYRFDSKRTQNGAPVTLQLTEVLRPQSQVQALASDSHFSLKVKLGHNAKFKHGLDRFPKLDTVTALGIPEDQVTLLIKSFNVHAGSTGSTTYGRPVPIQRAEFVKPLLEELFAFPSPAVRTAESPSKPKGVEQSPRAHDQDESLLGDDYLASQLPYNPLKRRHNVAKADSLHFEETHPPKRPRSSHGKEELLRKHLLMLAADPSAQPSNASALSSVTDTQSTSSRRYINSKQVTTNTESAEERYREPEVRLAQYCPPETEEIYEDPALAFSEEFYHRLHHQSKAFRTAKPQGNDLFRASFHNVMSLPSHGIRNDQAKILSAEFSWYFPAEGTTHARNNIPTILFPLLGLSGKKNDDSEHLEERERQTSEIQAEQTEVDEQEEETLPWAESPPEHKTARAQRQVRVNDQRPIDSSYPAHSSSPSRKPETFSAGNQATNTTRPRVASASPTSLTSSPPLSAQDDMVAIMSEDDPQREEDQMSDLEEAAPFAAGESLPRYRLSALKAAKGASLDAGDDLSNLSESPTHTEYAAHRQSYSHKTNRSPKGSRNDPQSSSPRTLVPATFDKDLPGPRVAAYSSRPKSSPRLANESSDGILGSSQADISSESVITEDPHIKARETRRIYYRSADSTNSRAAISRVNATGAANEQVRRLSPHGDDGVDFSRPRSSLSSLPSAPQHSPTADVAGPSQSARFASTKPSFASTASTKATESPVSAFPDTFQVFRNTYPDYDGDRRHFMSRCKYFARAKTGLHKFMWDDFIVREKTDYARYLSQCQAQAEEAMPYEAFYNKNVDEPIHTSQIVTPVTLKILLEGDQKSMEKAGAAVQKDKTQMDRVSTQQARRPYDSRPSSERVSSVPVADTRHSPLPPYAPRLAGSKSGMLSSTTRVPGSDAAGASQSLRSIDDGDLISIGSSPLRGATNTQTDNNPPFATPTQKGVKKTSPSSSRSLPWKERSAFVSGEKQAPKKDSFSTSSNRGSPAGRPNRSQRDSVSSSFDAASAAARRLSQLQAQNPQRMSQPSLSVPSANSSIGNETELKQQAQRDGDDERLPRHSPGPRDDQIQISDPERDRDMSSEDDEAFETSFVRSRRQKLGKERDWIVTADKHGGETVPIDCFPEGQAESTNASGQKMSQQWKSDLQGKAHGSQLESSSERVSSQQTRLGPSPERTTIALGQRKLDKNVWWRGETPFKEFARSYEGLKIHNAPGGLGDGSGRNSAIDILSWEL